MRDIVRPKDVPAYSPPLHAGTVNRRLVGKDVNGSARVEVRALVIYAPPLERSGAAQPFKPA